MAGIKDFQKWEDDFNGTVATFQTSADPATPWLVDDVSATGTPTYTRGTSEATLTLNNDNAAVIVALHFGDALDFDIDLIQSIEMRVKIGASSFTSGSELVFGLASARNDTLDSVAAHAWFKLAGSSSIVVETDDGVLDNDDISAGTALVTTYKRFYIDFTGGKSNVKFYVDGARVAGSRVFDMSNYSAGLQPIVQIQKGVNTNADSVIVDYVQVIAKRA